MAKAWYAIHVYSGYDENKVGENIRHRFQSMGMENKISIGVNIQIIRAFTIQLNVFRVPAGVYYEIIF